MPDDVVLWFVGEGKTDVGELEQSAAPTQGVVVILTSKILQSPPNLRVISKDLFRLRGKNLRQKVRFTKRQAKLTNGVRGLVFVIDSEGDLKQRTDLEAGRDAESPEYPMAVGIAHPCVETWLLADEHAIHRAAGLSKIPSLPAKPEELPAPRTNRKNNPKTALRDVIGTCKREVSVAEKDAIAREIRRIDQLEERCSIGFKPFAAEIRTRCGPLFHQLDQAACMPPQAP